MSLEWGLPTVCGILKGAVTLIKDPVKYAMSSESFANDLREEVRKLDNEARRVGDLAQVARNNCRNLNDVFTHWQQKANKALDDAQKLLPTRPRPWSTTCCYVTLPDPYCRYRFSTKAEPEIQVIRELTQECKGFTALDNICFINTASGNVTAPTLARRDGEGAVQSTTATASVFPASTSIEVRNDGVFESRALMIRKIMGALADNSNSVVGVYGMGGIGKSTLLVDVEREIREGKLFHWVVKADVSKNPDIETIQGEIADALGLTEITKKETISGRARLLHDRLKGEEREKKKVLIILDNLWKGLELNKVGIPCGHDNRVIGCKLLLTSRDRDVLRSEMSCDKDFLLGELEEEEARSLFERLVGDKVHDDKFKPVVDEALHKCFGMPFLIVHMATVFKHVDLPEWKNVLKQIKLSKNDRINEVINKKLQWSYENLKAAEKSLLALCVACGTARPSFEYLVRYGMGYGLFQNDENMEEARESLKSRICSLQASSLLLEDGDTYGFKIHDLVQEFVASVTSRDQPLLILKDKDKSITGLLKDKLKSCWAVCFPYVDVKELPQELDCPELQIFLLFTDNESLEVPYSLFRSMRKLMVLDLTGIRLTYSPSLSFQFLENLHTLCLDNCSLENVAFLGELKGLHILSFVNSNIYQLPREIGQLVELRLLDLNDCSQLEIIEPGVLQSLINLEELYMQNSFAQWNAMDQTPPTNASLIELNHMKNLNTLRVSIPDPRMLPKDLNLEKLTKYEIQIGNVWHWQNVWHWPRRCKGSRTLKLELDPLGDVLRKECIQSILGQTEDLFLDELDSNKQSVCTLSQKGFPKLKHLQVENNSSIHYIFQLSSRTHFTMLESLLLMNLNNLEMIFNGHISSKSFSTLKVIQVRRCDKMEVLFPLSVVRGLPQLEEIKVVGCKRMRGIVDANDGSKVELHNLRVLKLCDLPDIKSFLDVGMAPLSSTLHDQVGTQIAFFNEQQVAFSKLETLEVKGLDNIEFLFSPFMIKSFTQLIDLRVSYCKKMEAIITKEEGLALEISETLAFPMLTNLELNCLKSLMSFSHEKCSREARSQDYIKSCSTALFSQEVAFSRLETLGISGLDNVEVLFFPSMIKSLPQLKYLDISNCKKMETIIMEEEGLGLEVPETLAFPMLTKLNLNNLESLMCFSHEKCSRETQSQDRIKSCSIALFNREVAFSKLETLEIDGLDNVEVLFFPSMIKSLTQLRYLDISNCKKMEAIIMEEEGLGLEMSETLAFPMLTELNLNNLESLMCFFHGKRSREIQSQGRIKSCSTALFNREVQCPKLEQMFLSHMDNLSKIWSDGPQETLTFDNLRKVQVQNCRSLKNVFPRWVATSLTQLKDLQVESCGIEEIVASGNETPHSNGTQGLLPELTSLVLHDMPQLKNFCTNLPTSNWSSLKELRVTHSDKANMLSFVASMSNWAQKDDQQGLSDQDAHSLFERDFPNLERLLLVDNDIQMIRDRNFPEDIFGKPKALTLACFHDEKAIFPLKFLLERFQNLQSLEVFCSSFEDIFLDEGLVDNGKHPMLESLRELKLNKLHNLKSVWREGSLVLKILQSIETFEVWDCPCLTTIFPTLTSFKNLTTLVVKNSSGLVHLVTASMVTNLVKLNCMTIIGCERMKEIVANDGDEEGRVIWNLYELTLRNLPNLECFSSIPSCIFKFPFLWSIEVEECPKMKTFSKGTLSTPILEDVSLFRDKWDGNWGEGDDLNTTIQNLSA